MRSAKRWLIVFVVVSFFESASAAFSSYFSFLRIAITMSVALLGLVALAMATFRCTQAMPRPPALAGYMHHVWIFGAFILLLGAIGVVRGNDATWVIVAQELWVLAIIFFFMILGRYDEIWRFLYKPMVVYFFLGLLLIVTLLDRPGTTLWNSSAGFQVSQEFATSTELALDVRRQRTLGYDLRGLLEFWPALFAIAYFASGRQKFWRFLGLIAPMVCLGVQVFVFKFRSVLGAILLQVFAVVFLVPVFRRKLRLGMAFTVMLLGAAALAYVARTESFQHTLQRFDEDEKWSYRWREFEAVRDQVGGVSMLIGDGIAGWYPAPGTDMSYYRYETHVGLLQPFLKGGLLFCVVLFAMILRFLLPKPRGWYDNPYNAAGVAILPVFLASQVMIPFPTVLLHLQAVLLGLSCARMGTAAEESPAGEEGLPSGEAGYLAPVEGYAYD